MHRFICSFFIGLMLCLVLNALPTMDSSLKAREIGNLIGKQSLIESNDVLAQAAAEYALGHYKQAITLWENLLQNSKKVDEADISAKLGAAYRQIGDLSKAIQYWEGAIQIYRLKKGPQSRLLLAEVLTDQAQAYNALGQFRTSTSLSQEAINIARQNQVLQIEAVAQGALGNAYATAGDYEKAIQSYLASLKLAITINNSSYIVSALNNQANIFNIRSQKYFAQADSAQREGDQEEENRLTDLAQQDKVASLDAAQSAVEKSKANGGLPAVKSLLNLVHLLDQKSGSRQKLLAYRQQALEILEKLPDSRGKAYALINLASSEEETQSLKILEQAITVARNTGDHRSESFALGAKGEIYEQRGDLSKALELTQQAQFAAQQVSAADSLYRWQWQTGRIYQSSGRSEDAISSYKEAVSTLQSIRSDIITANRDLQLDVRDQVEPVYRELIGLLLDNNQGKESIKEALQFSELLKLGELQSFFGDECLEVAEAITSSEDIITQANEAVISSIILNKKTYLTLQLPDSSISSYAVPITAKELQFKIENFRLLLEKVGTDEYLDEARSLYDLLIRPLETALNKAKPDTLVFVNDGVLRNIPMAALHDGKNFLVEKYPIAVTLSKKLIAYRSKSKNKPALVFGLTVKIPPFNALPYINTETEFVQKLLGGSRFLNKDFTLNKLENKIKQNYPVVHLATHGKFSGTYGNSFLQAFDGRVSLGELEEFIRSKKQPLSLLTLSACQTAAGDDHATLGFAGLAVRSGVESVLASLWFVNDAGTVPLIKDFYAETEHSDLTKAQALRNAQLKAIADPKLAHPSIWSAFVLVGNYN